MRRKPILLATAALAVFMFGFLWLTAKGQEPADKRTLKTEILLATASESKPNATGVLVQVVLPEKVSVIAELGRENDTNIEFFDLETGEGSIYRKSDLVRINKHVSDNFAAQTIGLPKLLRWKIAKVMPRTAPKGVIANIDGSLVYVTLGSKHGMSVGDTLNVFRGEDTLTDPVTGEVLGKQRRRISELEITEVRQKYSKVRQMGDLEIALAVGDEVEPERFTNSVAIIPPCDLAGRNTKAGVKLAEELTVALAKSGIPVVERSLLLDALRELAIQQTVLFDPAKVAQVGRLVGAHSVLTGTLFQEGRTARVNLRLVDVETGKILDAVACSIRDMPGVTTTVTVTPSGGSGDSATLFL